MLETVTDKLFTTNSLLPVPETLLPEAPPTPALNRHPLGADRIRVLFVWVGKSPLAASWITMLPNIVKPGAAPFWARSAERPVPPVAAVTMTSARAGPAPSQARAQTGARRLRNLEAACFFIN